MHILNPGRAFGSGMTEDYLCIEFGSPTVIGKPVCGIETPPIDRLALERR